MREKVFLVHGWSVTETTTYQALHEQLARNGFDLKEVYLGRYVSLDDHVEVRDLARAMHLALRTPECLGRGQWKTPFHIITHSTGALVVRQWIVRHYKGKRCAAKPLKNVVFLAGPHFGSRLAHHGRSMLAHAAYWGDTGNRVLEALELGSGFSWQTTEDWMNPAHWKQKGIRPYCLIGDKVKTSFFKRKIFPAGAEEGSDMVVRVPAGNANVRRYELNLVMGRERLVGQIGGIPFAALDEFTHSGPDYGIMNSIKRDTRVSAHRGLKLILRCLGVGSAAGYVKVRKTFESVTRKTRKERQGFAQLDFRFRDQDGKPVDDYSFVMGAIVDGRKKLSKTIAHIHKNKVDPSHLTAFVNMKHFEKQYAYFFSLTADTDTDLVEYAAPRHDPEFSGKALTQAICADRTTQIDVILHRVTRPQLFVFHRGDDPALHVKWDRLGNVRKSALPIE